jgi:hypothetical protein
MSFTNESNVGLELFIIWTGSTRGAFQYVAQRCGAHIMGAC